MVKPNVPVRASVFECMNLTTTHDDEDLSSLNLDHHTVSVIGEPLHPKEGDEARVRYVAGHQLNESKANSELASTGC